MEHLSSSSHLQAKEPSKQQIKPFELLFLTVTSQAKPSKTNGAQQSSFSIIAQPPHLTSPHLNLSKSAKKSKR